MQNDPVNNLVQDRHGNFLFAEAGSGPPPLAADGFLREIAPDGTIVAESPLVCGITMPGRVARRQGLDLVSRQ
jgi:hypothetical protein